MTDDEIRIEIATFAGWKKVEVYTHKPQITALAIPEQQWSNGERIELWPPDYPNSLDAIQVVVLGLDEDTLDAWLDCLEEIVGYDSSKPDALFAKLVNATARQRCEALLRSVGRGKG